jgi:hypothetical protein
MPLHQADIHLHRARLFGRKNDSAPYPWDSPQHDLAEARRLIGSTATGAARKSCKTPKPPSPPRAGNPPRPACTA